MTIRTFLAALALATLICVAAWIAIAVSIDPYSASWTSLALFYFSLFLWVCGVLILLGFYIRYLLKPSALPYSLIAVSVRQAIILAIGLDAVLVLKGAHIFNWVNGIFLLFAMIFVESYFLSSPRSKNHK